ncbi:MAG: toll/interleukin-1 receptor domain-containing protein [Lachnospiraceae bacterium]|nr:toll/interleukin-1 receptor domain-containing protein [Lachnospiraceae bacterium]
MMNFLDNFIKMERETGSSWEKDNVAIFYYEGDRWAADKIARDILRIYDCSIYLSQYQLVGMEQEELEAILQEMMFSVFVISKNFLTTENSAKDFALQTVLRLGMRFMPVQVESEIEGLFDQKVGAFHLIDSQKDNYEEAMNAYLDSYTNADLQIVRPEQLFFLKGFISYRKKNSLCMKRLIKELRSYPKYRCVSLWFDGSLHPGENYNDQIAQKLSESDFVLFVVTPDLLEPGNYVLEKEYVQAINEGKHMIAVILEEVDLSAFREAYPKLNPIPLKKLEAAMEEMMDPAAYEEYIYAPDRNYFLAEAFERGKETELNVVLAYDLYREGAEAGEPYSMARLAHAYTEGVGFILPKDRRQAESWRKPALEAFLRDPDKTPGSRQQIFLLADEQIRYMTLDFTIEVPQETFDEIEDLCMLQIETCAELPDEMISARINPAKAFLRAAQTSLACKNRQQAARYFYEAECRFSDLSSRIKQDYYYRQFLDELYDGKIGIAEWEPYTISGPNGFEYEDGIIPEGFWGDENGNYRASSYKCPHCGERLYVTTFLTGKDPVLFVDPGNERYISPSRMFVCPCGRFFAAPKGKRLKEGYFLEMRVVHDAQDQQERDDFQRWLDHFDRLGDLYAQRNE